MEGFEATLRDVAGNRKAADNRGTDCLEDACARNIRGLSVTLEIPLHAYALCMIAAKSRMNARVRFERIDYALRRQALRRGNA